MARSSCKARCWSHSSWHFARFPLPTEVKAQSVALVGIAASFTMAWLLVTRTRVRRIL